MMKYAMVSAAPNSSQSPHNMAAWQNMHSIPVKQEVIDESDVHDRTLVHDSGISSAYTPSSIDRFTSSTSPSSSDHSRDSEPVQLVPNPYTSPVNMLQQGQIAMSPTTSIMSQFFNSTPVQSHANTTNMFHNTPFLPKFETIANNNNNELLEQNSKMELNYNSFSDSKNNATSPTILSPNPSESGDSESYCTRFNGDRSSPYGHFLSVPNGDEKRSVHENGDDSNESDFEDYDENNLRTPRVNSHGKIKIFKCKQCNYVADTKIDFWDHSKAHIKNDKLLTCPKCPFVTEYKHHLEYHLRNHFGSKPFKCDKCNYSCVNKSMLNSHVKSHSNVYQYRCRDCSYATKYCHSLKQHLKKYAHNPDMVLNPDGSPNPLTIIDVYGTRRGPKLKSILSKSQELNKINNMNSMNNLSIPTASSANDLPLQATSKNPIGNIPMFPPQFMQQSMPSLPFPFGSLLNAFQNNLPNPLLFPGNNDEPRVVEPTIDITSNSQEEQLHCGECDFSTVDSNTFSHHVAKMHKPKPLKQLFAASEKTNQLESISSKQSVGINRVGNEATAMQVDTGALDLTSKVSSIGSKSPTPDYHPPVTSNALPLTPSSKSRRKGRAYKLSHGALTFTQSNENGSNLELNESEYLRSDDQSVSDCVSDKTSEISDDDMVGIIPLENNYKNHSLSTRNIEVGSNETIKLPVKSPKMEERSISPGNNNNNNDPPKIPKLQQILEEKPKQIETVKPKPSENLPSEPTKTSEKPASDTSYTCEYCEINYKDYLLYRMHMGCHRINDNPFTCNMCGEQNADKVSFFLHIARSSHR